MNRILKFVALCALITGAPFTFAESIGVKALSGPPEEFNERRMPTTQAMMSSSSILMLGGEGEDRSPGQSFNVVAGEGFSVVQVTDTFPTFDIIRVYGPGNKRYEYDGVRLLCNGGPCGTYQAGLEMNEFDANDGGTMTLSVSGGEIAASGTWSVDVSPPLTGRGTATIDSMIGYEGEGISIGLAADPCLADASRCNQRGECAEPCAESRLNLTTATRPALVIALDEKAAAEGTFRAPAAVERVDLKIIDAQSRKVLHTRKIDTERASTLRRTSAGYPVIDLPSLPAGLNSVRADVVLRRDDGALVQRTLFYALPIVEANITLTGKVGSSVLDERRMQIDLELSANDANISHLHAYAEVWETQTNQPIAWISGMSAPVLDKNGTVTLPLTFDARWVALRGSGGSADLTLRNVRIQDPDTFLPFDQRAQLALTAVNLPRAAFQNRDTIRVDDDLFQFDSGRSVEVAVDDPVNAERGGAVGIVAVHGWCSSATWPIDDLDNLGVTRTFLDTNQSRSHDRFALRIRDQGNAFFSDAFTLIAHSQGGAASAHLRAFYSSRLDNATAPRRIQTMGTPYGGSTLMDLYVGVGGVWGLVLSEIFGFCGPQLSLTTVGSAVWRIGIPNSVRNEVFYYRTRHRRPGNLWQRLQFWRWRCNVVSFIIPGTDDGVVSTGQGSFGNARNMGIRDSQCHTGGMNHSAQTRDTARNAIMEREARPAPPPPPSPPDARCQVESFYQSGGPFGGYYYYYVNAGSSSAGGSPIASYQWTLNGSPNPPGGVTRFGPLSPGLPGQASSYAVRVTVRDTAGRSDSATCYVP